MYVLYHRRDDHRYEKQHCFNEHKGIRLTLYSALYPGRLVSVHLRPVRYQCRRPRHHFLLTSVGCRIRGHYERLCTRLRRRPDCRRPPRRPFRTAAYLPSRAFSFCRDLGALRCCSDSTAACCRTPSAGAFGRGHGAAGTRSDSCLIRRECTGAGTIRIRRVHWTRADHGAGTWRLDSCMGFSWTRLAHDFPCQHADLPDRRHWLHVASAESKSCTRGIPKASRKSSSTLSLSWLYGRNSSQCMPVRRHCPLLCRARSLPAEYL